MLFLRDLLKVMSNWGKVSDDWGMFLGDSGRFPMAEPPPLVETR
jgi:hypothetical protein